MSQTLVLLRHKRYPHSMKADLMAPGAQQKRLAAYLNGLTQAAGHADRAVSAQRPLPRSQRTVSTNGRKPWGGRDVRRTEWKPESFDQMPAQNGYLLLRAVMLALVAHE